MWALVPGQRHRRDGIGVRILMVVLKGRVWVGCDLRVRQVKALGQGKGFDYISCVCI